MTQTCDLENEKVTEVLVAKIVSWPDAVNAAVEAGNTYAKSERFRKALVDGNVPSVTLLHKSEDGEAIDWSIVDFHHLYVVPKKFVVATADRAGRRLRLLSPYREHVGQAFACYFMRVGLPHEANDFIKEGAS